jgi:hypothetical protein
MSWIDDVRAELAALDLSPRALRRFSWVLGAALLLAAGYVSLRRHAPAAGAGLAAAGLLLLALGFAAPGTLRPLYRPWMAFAFALGWVVSRCILTALFLLVLTPIGLLGRLAGARFLETRLDRQATTHWIRRDGRPAQHEKMY